MRDNLIVFVEHNIFRQKITEILEFITKSFEEDVKNLWRQFLGDEDRICLCGFGSFGRKTMTHFSDIDILILVDSKRQIEKLGDRISNFIAAMWNIFRKIEHAVRTPEETMKIALEDVKVLSYLSDLRFIAGDPQVFEKMKRIKKKFCSENFETVFNFLKQDRKNRISKYPNLLEPNIKDSPGGIGDFLYLKCIKDLVQKDILVDLKELRKDYEFLLQIRVALHHILKKNDDNIKSGVIEDLKNFVKEKTGKNTDIKELMTKILNHMNRIRVYTEISQEYIGKCIEERRTKTPEKMVKLGEYFLSDGKFIYTENISNPKVIIELFKAAKDNDLKISPEVSYRILRNRRLFKGIWKDKDCTRTMYEILSDLGGIGRTLRKMRDLEVLHNIIPEFSHVKNLYQVYPPHIYPVDLHLIKCAEETEKILLNIKPEHVKVLPDIPADKKWILIFASLLHDIGKGRKKDHSELGEKIAEKVAIRFGIAGENMSLLKFLVKNHLLLSHISQRRDIHEDNLLKKTAELFPDILSLDMLYILSIADALSTNPENWNAWKSHLISETYIKLSERIRRGLEYREEKHINISLLVDELSKFFPHDIVIKAVQSLSQKFLSFFNYDRLFRYILVFLKAYLSQSRFATFTLRDEGVIEIITIGDDVEGFLCECTGMLFVSGFNILSLYAEGGVLGKAINIFWAHPPDVGKFKKFAKIFYSKTLKEILPEIEQKKKKIIPYFMETNIFARHNTEDTIKIFFDNSSSEDYTIMEVYCFDRPGLLFDITYVLVENGYDISVAKISTRENKVADVFYIRDKRKTDGKLSKDQIEELREKIKRAIIQV